MQQKVVQSLKPTKTQLSPNSQLTFTSDHLMFPNLSANLQINILHEITRFFYLNYVKFPKSNPI